MKALLSILTSLRVGESLENSAGWKKWQGVINALIALATAGMVFLPEQYQLPPETVETVMYSLIGLATTLNSYWTFSTSEKVGILPEKK